jgi:hypothetical protein
LEWGRCSILAVTNFGKLAIIRVADRKSCLIVSRKMERNAFECEIARSPELKRHCDDIGDHQQPQGTFYGIHRKRENTAQFWQLQILAMLAIFKIA